MTTRTAATMIARRCRRWEPRTCRGFLEPPTTAVRPRRGLLPRHRWGVSRPQPAPTRPGPVPARSYRRPMRSPPVPPSRRRRVRVRRLLWRWRHALLAVGLVSAVGVVVQEVRPPAPATVAVVVLARDVPAGAPLAETDVRTLQLPREVVAARTLRAPAEAVGQR